MNQKQNCKKLVYKTPASKRPTIVLGIVLSDDGKFIRFRTANKTHEIHRDYVLSIEDTDTPFRGEEE